MFHVEIHFKLIESTEWEVSWDFAFITQIHCMSIDIKLSSLRSENEPVSCSLLVNDIFIKRKIMLYRILILSNWLRCGKWFILYYWKLINHLVWQKSDARSLYWIWNWGRNFYFGMTKNISNFSIFVGVDNRQRMTTVNNTQFQLTSCFMERDLRSKNILKKAMMNKTQHIVVRIWMFFFQIWVIFHTFMKKFPSIFLSFVLV